MWSDSGPGAGEASVCVVGLGFDRSASASGLYLELLVSTPGWGEEVGAGQME